MRVAIVGAGLVGLTTAWEMRADGHDVTVYERRATVAAEATFAPAGLQLPDLPVITGPGRRGGEARGRSWFARLLGKGPKGLPAPARLALACRLARYSHDRIDALCAQLELSFERTRGITLLFREAADRELADATLQALADAQIHWEALDAAQARAIEPALSPHAALHQAVRLPDEGSINARQFAYELKARAQQAGVAFQLGREVHIERDGTGLRLAGTGDAQTDRRDAFDAIVLCTGADAASVLRPLGLALPLTPVWGYSVTLAVRHRDDIEHTAPRSALFDAQAGVAMMRLGQRVRVAGGAEVGGTDADLRPEAVQMLFDTLEHWFPGSVDLGNPQQWRGARAMLPDSLPVVGPSGQPGLWLNLGHGDSGVALACGCARVIADEVAQRPTAIDTRGLGYARFQGDLPRGTPAAPGSARG